MLASIACKVNTSTKIKVLIIVSIILMISQSIFLIMAMTSFAFIVLFLYNVNIKYYINILKSVFLWLILISIICIFVFSSIISGLIFVYKIFIILLLLSNFLLTNDFYKIHSGFYKCLSKLDDLGINAEIISYNISIFITFLHYLINSKIVVQERQKLKGKKNIGLKYCFVPSIILSISNIQLLQRTLLLEKYKLRNEKLNYVSKILELCLLLLFIVAVIKEVML